MTENIIKIDGKWYIDLDLYDEKEKENKQLRDKLEACDICIEKILDKAQENFYDLVITSDHGNVELMKDSEAKGMTEYGIRNMLEQRINKAIEYINKTQMPEGYKKMLLEILGDKENESN